MFAHFFNSKARQEKKQRRQQAEHLALEAIADFETGKTPQQSCPGCGKVIQVITRNDFLYASCTCELCNVAMQR